MQKDNPSARFDPAYAAMPFGIVVLNADRTKAMIDELGAAGALPDVRKMDQNTVCALYNSTPVAYANQVARELLGGMEDTHSSLGPALHEESRRAFVDGMIRFFRSSDQIAFEAQVRSPSGSEMHLLFNIWKNPQDEAGKEICVGLANFSARMMSEEVRENLQSELAHAARITLLGEMTASIGHEVNQPLGSIVTNAEAGLRWLNREEPDLAEVGAILQRIVSNGKRAADIISAMRGLARHGKPEQGPISLDTLIEEAVIILRPELARRQVTLRLELAPDMPDVLADRTQILQVLVNLALNAAQAMSDGQAWNRTLLIRTWIEKSLNAVIEVEDSGPGVDPSVREKLFQSFYTTKATGVGMGLAICRSIIEAHDSTIELQSSPHLGARFSFRLRLSQRETEAITQ
ncbi:sensor histidine kinase [Neorhizobium alkalisoli]|jgi:signal transduction histidine kinase|uniref:histidine kinase n=1 Tax=Neorhizobium alkalisoli TaxID=528178 RepID=A0A561Q0T0_9HYPH|nr:ATP-binding protein [Neorhizobium alkalisoli]TWF43935.1 phospho-acceptor domain-containing protein [Neorhizobium alkalisoli]